MIDVKIDKRVAVTARSIMFELVAVDDSELPSWDAGANLTLLLPSGLSRQYSLCGDPTSGGPYRIVVLGEIDSRGGSEEVHTLPVGKHLQIQNIRNDFALKPADRYLLVAGGIGITPIISMAWELYRAEKPFQVVFATRTVDATRLLTLLPPACDLEIRLSSQGNRLDASEIARDVVPGTAIYCCGPAGMIDAFNSLEQQIQDRGATFQAERFTASGAIKAGVHSNSDSSFRVTFARSEESVDVAPEETILSCARRLGKVIESSCEEGYCGTCETTVLEGVADHRDDFLSEAEKAEGASMMICVSRARTSTLTLDL